MKCRQCKSQAVINMRQHKLALCKTHYSKWFIQQTERFIKKYRMFTRDERVLVAVSGGKDSLALWHILDRLGYKTQGLYIAQGIDGGIGYSDISRSKIEKFLASRPHLSLITIDVEQLYGATIPLAAQVTYRGQQKPCSVCGLTKRHVMNRIATEGQYDVLVTGHNLDDEAAVLFGNTMNWSVDYLVRQGPVLSASSDGLARKVKPFCRFYEREVTAFALVTGIDYVYDECPYAVGATSIYHKELLNRMEEERPGTKLNFYLNFLRAKEKHELFNTTADEINLHICSTCGQPTTIPGQCAFCRTWDTVRSRVGAGTALQGLNQ
jgi:uncharacterized protein (TIGR00269 family)